MEEEEKEEEEEPLPKKRRTSLSLEGARASAARNLSDQERSLDSLSLRAARMASAKDHPHWPLWSSLSVSEMRLWAFDYSEVRSSYPHLSSIKSHQDLVFEMIEINNSRPDFIPPRSRQEYERWEKGNRGNHSTVSWKQHRMEKQKQQSREEEEEEAEEESLMQDDEMDEEYEDEEMQQAVAASKSTPQPRAKQPLSQPDMGTRHGQSSAPPLTRCCFCTKSISCDECLYCGSHQSFSASSAQNTHFRAIFLRRIDGSASSSSAAAAQAINIKGTSQIDTSNIGSGPLRLFEKECVRVTQMGKDMPFPLFARPADISESEEKALISRFLSKIRVAHGGLDLVEPPQTLIELVQSGMMTDMSAAIPFTIDEVQAAAAAGKTIGAHNEIVISTGGQVRAGVAASHGSTSRPMHSSSLWLDAFVGTILPALIARPMALASWVALTRSALNLEKRWGWERAMKMMTHQLTVCTKERVCFAQMSQQVVQESMLNMGQQERGAAANRGTEAANQGERSNGRTTPAKGNGKGAGSQQHRSSSHVPHSSSSLHSVHSGRGSAPPSPFRDPHAPVCRSYNRGNCFRGDDVCKYRHVCATPGCESADHVEANCHMARRGNGTRGYGAGSTGGTAAAAAAAAPNRA